MTRRRTALSLLFVVAISAAVYWVSARQSTPSVSAVDAPTALSAVAIIPDKKHPAPTPGFEPRPAVADTPVVERQPTEPVPKAVSFEEAINIGVVEGGEKLVRAFDIHDSCLGVPRSQRGLDAWYTENSALPDTNPDRMKRRMRECIGVPAFTFDTRRRMLEPLAKSNDVHAQFLLGTTFPYSFEAHEFWLRLSSEGGYAPAMVLLAQKLSADKDREFGRIEAHRLLTQAADQNHPFAASERTVLEATMSIGELRFARSDEQIESVESD